VAVELEDRVEDRLGKFESHIGHLQTDVSELKAEGRQWRSETNARFDRLSNSVARLEERVTRGDLQNRIWMLLLTGAVLAVMAHGFKWI
jgi:hypothetical protein